MAPLWIGPVSVTSPDHPIVREVLERSAFLPERWWRRSSGRSMADSAQWPTNRCVLAAIPPTNIRSSIIQSGLHF